VACLTSSGVEPQADGGKRERAGGPGSEGAEGRVTDAMETSKPITTFGIVMIVGALCAVGVCRDDVGLKGQHYYVDATGGDDANDGTSPDFAWKTLDRVNAGRFEPGDSVLFKRGQVWRGLLEFPSSGSEGLPITISAYGAGARPAINGSRASDEDGCSWTRSAAGVNEYYLTKAGANPGYHMPGGDTYMPGWVWYKNGPVRLLKGTVGALANGQWGWGDNDALGFSTIYVRNDAGVPGPVEIPQSYGIMNIVAQSYLELRGLAIQFGNLGTGLMICDASHHITVEDCEVAYNLRGGISIFGDYYDDHDSYTVVRDCNVHDVGGQGIAVCGEQQILGPGGEVVVPVRKVRFVTIENCEIHDVARSYFFDADGYGIKLAFVDHSSVIGCRSYNNFASGLNLDGNRPGREGVEVPLAYQTGCNDNEIAYNLVHHNRAGINLEVSSRNNIHHNMVYGNDPTFWPAGMCCLWHSKDNAIYYNIIFDNSDNGPGLSIAPEGCTGTQIFNNVIIGGARGVGVGDSSAAGTVLMNNIIMATEYPFLVDTSPGCQIVSDYNVWYGGLGMGDYPPVSFAQWRANTGNDMHSLTVDPRFRDLDGGDFRLAWDSPCIDAGIDVGLDTDIEGTTVPQDGDGDGHAKVDISAYEAILPDLCLRVIGTAWSPDGRTATVTYEANRPVQRYYWRIFQTQATYTGTIATQAVFTDLDEGYYLFVATAKGPDGTLAPAPCRVWFFNKPVGADYEVSLASHLIDDDTLTFTLRSNRPTTKYYVRLFGVDDAYVGTTTGVVTYSVPADGLYYFVATGKEAATGSFPPGGPARQFITVSTEGFDWY